MRIRSALLLILAFLIPFSSLLAQNKVTIELTRSIRPVAEGKRNYLIDTVRVRLQNGKDSSFRPIDQFNLVGGDFTDGKVRFTIIENLKGNKADSRSLLLAPYRADSVAVPYMMFPHNNNDEEDINQMLVIKAFGKEYGATLSTDGESVTMQRLEGQYKNPDLQLWDSLLPDATFKLINGGSSSFKDYEHQNKYIYLVFWGTWQPGSLQNMKQIDDLKNISALYENALTIISLHSDTLTVKQIEKDKNIEWVEAKDGFEGEYFPPMYGRPGGILFSSDGRAIHIGLGPEELKQAIEKLLHVGE